MNARSFNPVFAGLPTTIFTVMSALAVEHGAINLGQGFPDIDGPDEIRAVAAKALTDGPSDDWREVLGFERFEAVTRKMVDRRHRELVKQHHPDMGGDRHDFERVMRAREDALEEIP